MSEDEPPEFPLPAFLPPESPSSDPLAPPPPEPKPRRAPFGGAWPFVAVGVLVAGALVAVFALLHPRQRGAAASDEALATVTAETASLRKEPSARGAVVATLTQGQRVHVRAEAAPWVDVASDSGSGFLPADAVEKDADRDARQRRARTLLELAPVYGVVAEDAEIALAPDPAAARAGTLAKGTVIAIHSVDHSYFAFADKKWGVAFVDSARVDLVPPDPRQPVITPEKVRPLKDLTVIDLAAEPPPDEGEAPGEEPAGGSTPPAAPAAAVPAEPAPGLLEPPAALTRVEPAYPDMAKRAGVEGTVELEVSIDAAGRVTDVEVVRGLPMGLSEAATEAVRQWTWRPARAASGPVASRRTVRVRFLLHPEDEH
ncbi:MAG TPA: TonB family protein, partial [Thermoanaerobaculia bacterium]|nr:TonB family protein [Thermoanaerobaculia bacterium]